MLLYCLKCRKNTENNNPKLVNTRNRRKNAYIKICSMWYRRGYSFRKRLVKKCLICNASFVNASFVICQCLICHLSMPHLKVGSEEIFNFPMLHIASHFCIFSRIFQSFLTLSKQQLLYFLGWLFLDENPHKCNINTQHI